MTEKTFSQKIARAFEIASYFLSIPAAVGVFFATLLIGDAPWFTFLIWSVAGYGVFLMTRYFKHSRDRLIEKRVASMWIGTAIFNSLFFLPMLILFVKVMAFDFSLETTSSDVFGWLFAWLLVLCGYGSAIVLSLKAYQSNRNQKYR